MRLTRLALRAATACAALAAALPASAQVERTEINRIIEEGTNQSEVVVTAQHLTDVIGSRLTNSPGMRRAEEWTQARFRDWGLRNVRKEGFEFGRGWSINASSVRMVTPRPIQLTAIPIAWTPSTNGTISAPVIVAPITAERHFDKWRGQLRGKIVLISRPTQGSEPTDSAVRAVLGRRDREARSVPPAAL